MEKALIVTPFFRPNIGGAETFAEDLAKALSKKYIVHVCTIKWEKPIIWQGMDLLKAIKLAWKLLLPLRKMTKEYKYEKVFALGLIPTFLCAMLRIKFSTVILALYDFYKPTWFTWMLNRADKIFVEGNKGELDMFNVGVKIDKIVQFQHWCDQTRFCWVERHNKNIKVLFVGRPIKIKGIEIVKECELYTKGVDYEYVENVPYQELPKYYQAADIVVVPSLYSEGFSRVVIEAASCGCALIVSDKGALPELVKDFGTVELPRSFNFATRINQLQVNRIGLEKIQLATVLYAKEHFSEANADCFLM